MEVVETLGVIDEEGAVARCNVVRKKEFMRKIEQSESSAWSCERGIGVHTGFALSHRQLAVRQSDS